MHTVHAPSESARKRAVTIHLPDALVADIEIAKIESRACGLVFSVTEICAAALAEAIPRARAEFQRRSDIMGLPSPYLGNRADT